MASNKPKRESLSRYFKDLDEYENSSGDSDDETNQDDNNSNEKLNNVAIPQGGSVNKSTANKPTGKPEFQNNDSGNKLGKQLPSVTVINTDKKRADVKGDADGTDKKNKLPSATECLSTRSNPSFLKISEGKEINWDTREKRLEGGDEVAGTTDFSSNSVPPPSSYEPITDPGIKVVDSEGRKRKTVWDDLEDQTTSTKAYKVHKDEEGGDEGDDGS